MSYHSPPPRSELWQFVMIGNHILVQATASTRSKSAPARTGVASAQQPMASAQLPVVKTHGVPSDDGLLAETHTSALNERAGTSTAAELPDEVVLQRSAGAYAAAGLSPKPSKRFRKEAVFNVAGARVDGRQGWVSAKIELILGAIALSVQMVASRTWSSSILATTNTCWVQILLYRSAGFCLLERAYQVVAAAGRRIRSGVPCIQP